MEVKPYKNSEEDKKHQLERMFNNIAPKYDFLNHFLSLGIDRYWRSSAIRMLSKSKPKIMLDIATGTADLAIESVRLSPDKIFGIDISSDMLEIGKLKIKKRSLQEKIQLLQGDSEDLIFEDNKFDAVTVGFGVRNFQDLKKGIAEIHRVLKPGGKLLILEFSQPTNRFIRKLYDFYSSRITPGIGKMISKDKYAYSYLCESVRQFPSGNEFAGILKEMHFSGVSFKPLTFGVATVYLAEK